MTHNEFLKWCTDRWFDGLWYTDIGIQCIHIADTLYSMPPWKRKQYWNKLNANNFIEKYFVEPVNQRISEGIRGG